VIGSAYCDLIPNLMSWSDEYDDEHHNELLDNLIMFLKDFNDMNLYSKYSLVNNVRPTNFAIIKELINVFEREKRIIISKSINQNPINDSNFCSNFLNQTIGLISITSENHSVKKSYPLFNDNEREKVDLLTKRNEVIYENYDIEDKCSDNDIREIILESVKEIRLSIDMMSPTLEDLVTPRSAAETIEIDRPKINSFLKSREMLEEIKTTEENDIRDINIEDFENCINVTGNHLSGEGNIA
jgi:hypothetical protein